MLQLLSIGTVLFPALLLIACGGGSGGGPAPDATTTDFTQFVKDQFDATDNVSDPVEINDLELVGLESDDETLFDDVLAREADRDRKPVSGDGR